MTTLENINTTNYYKSKSGVFGKIDENSLDLGDYGFCPMVDIIKHNGEIAYSIAINNITEISFEDYADLVELTTGNRPTE
jgi:hypothetical protein